MNLSSIIKSVTAKISDGTTTAGVDEVGGALTTITYPHHEIHEGDMFKTDLNDADLDEDAVKIIAFKTPDTTKRCHVIILAVSTGEAVFEFLEAPTLTSDTGSSLNVYNRDRSSIKTSQVWDNTATPVQGQATEDPTITDDGTVLHHELMGEGKNKTSGYSRDLSEYILAQDTWYAYRITSEKDNNVVQLTLNWYEHG